MPAGIVAADLDDAGVADQQPRMNPVSEWVWSPELTHEANIDLETFVQAQADCGTT